MSQNILAKQANKRQFLKGLTALMGATAVSQIASSNALASAIAYRDNAGSTARKLFTSAQFKILHDICAVVIPETDTPSAAQLDVHGFLDHQLVVCHSKKEQADAIAIVDSINDKGRGHYNQAFVALNAAQQTKLLEQLEAGELGFSDAEQQQFAALKALLVFGYLTTEVGATQVLAYQAVPGGFKGSIPYASVGKAYGSLAYY